MKFKLLLVTFFALVLNSVSSYGQAFTATYDFASVTTASGLTDPTAVPTATGATFGSFVSNVGTNSSAAGRFSLTNWDIGATNGNDVSFPGTINTGKYYQVTITPAAGYTLDINSITFTSQRSTTGIRQYSVRSSVDTYGANLPASISPANTNLTVVPTDVFQWALDAVSSAQNGSTITLGSSYDALSGATTFRFYGWNAEGTGGTFSIDNVVFSGTANQATTTSIGNGDWSTAATWDNGVPTATKSAVIKHGVYLTSSVTRNSGVTTTVDAGAFLYTGSGGYTFTNNGTANINGTFQIDSGGFADGTGTFNYGTTGTLNFNTNSDYTVNSGHVYWPTANGPINVNVLQGGITFGAGTNRTVTGIFSTANAGATNGVDIPVGITLTLSGTTRMDSGGFFKTSSPVYGSAATLIYNNTGTFARGFEWRAAGVGTIGVTAGYPNNITITNNTTLSYNNGNPAAKAMYGSLTINGGSTFDMTDGAAAVANPLTIGGSVTNSGTFKFSYVASPVLVAGDVTNSGTLTLGTIVGADLRLGGNFANTGTFNGNSRAVYFTKTGMQTVSSSTALTIPYLRTTGGGTTVQLLNDVTISAPNGVDAINFGNASDIIDLNGHEVIIGTAAVANTISGAAGTFKAASAGPTNSKITLRGTGSVGTLSFTTGFEYLGTLVIDRTATAVACVMGTNVSIVNGLTLTNGLVDLAATTMTLENGVNPTGSSGSYVIADVTAAGVLRKAVTATGSQVFPIGDRTASTDASQYSPATVNFTAGTFTTAYLGMAVEDSKEPNLVASTDFLTRYWKLTTAGTFTSPTYTFTGTYLPVDITGTEGNSKSNQWDGTGWSNGGTVIGSNTVTKTASTILTTVNHITAGNRDQEIDVKGNNNNIVSGSTTTNGLNFTAFGTVLLGANLTKTYTILNSGGANLLLTGTPTVAISGGASAADFVVTTQPAVTTVAGETSTTFIITFTPSYSGTRTATVTIANNDATVAESPYTFVIDGNGSCPSTNTITPTSGPVGTEVTITATGAYDLTSAVVTFNGLASVETQVSPTVVTAIVPVGAVSGPLLTTNDRGCTASNTFTVIDNAANGCDGGLLASELFISEVTDATFGGLSYIEIYNGTSSSINLATALYSLKFYANANGTAYSTVGLTGTVAAGQTYVVSTAPTASICSSVTGGDGSLSNQSTGTAGINFADAATGDATLGHDHIALYKAAVNVDNWGVLGNQSWATPLNIGDRGATFRRKNTATVPALSYSNSDWNVSDWLGDTSTSCYTNDYSDIGKYNFNSGVLPSITTQPSYTPTCKATELSVVASEGYNLGGDTKELVYQWYAVPPGSNVWTALANGSLYNGVDSATLSISDVSTLTGYQFYCQVSENSSTCFIASHAVKITAGQSTTWQVGNTWSNGVPTIDTAVIIANNYDTANAFSPSFEACSLTILNTRTVTVRADDYVAIQNDLNVNTGGNLIVENDGSLVMNDDDGIVTNNGTTQIKRTSTPYELYDYVYWSSPITNANLASVFSAWRTDYSFQFTAANFSDIRTINSVVGDVAGSDSYDDYAPWAWSAYIGTMTPARGYAIMGPTSGTFSPSTPGAAVTFSGTVNNGVIPIKVYESANAASSIDDFNLVGNPYPSSIFADEFINHNGAKTSGTVYIWTHVDDVSTSNLGPDYANFINDDYATYNLSGGTVSASGSTEPTGYIASGQGFFIDADVNNVDIEFNNAMRSKDYQNDDFFRLSNPMGERDRLWLDIQNQQGLFSQLLLGYFNNTTLGYDWAYDGRLNMTNTVVSFYSLVADEKYKIQARPDFEESDVVPLGYFSATAGEFTISIGKKEGVFTPETQAVYLEDKALNIIHDLKQAPYTFTTNYGRFDNRFQLRYTTSSLGTPDFETLNNSVLVASNHGEISIKSYLETINEVTVYDILGRQLFYSKDINNNDFAASNISVSQQSLIVKIRLESGTVVTRKVIIN